MRGWAGRLAELGSVSAFDYGYQLEKRRRPDPLPTLVARHREMLAGIRAGSTQPVVLAGKSMGSRIGCHVALEESVAGLVCFGYPLQAAGSGKLRDEVLLNLKTPILFVQGTKDPLCPLPLLESVRKRMKARSALHIVEGGDHSLRVSKRMPQGPVDDAVLEVLRRFLESL
jgi:hypothetical protein